MRSKITNKLVRKAQRLACIYGHTKVGPEHLVLAMLDARDGLAVRALNSLGITSDTFRDELVRMVPLGTIITAARDISWRPATEEVFQQAWKMARLTGKPEIEPEDVLLDIAYQDSSVALRVLVNLDVNADQIIEAVIKQMDQQRAA